MQADNKNKNAENNKKNAKRINYRESLGFPCKIILLRASL